MENLILIGTVAGIHLLALISPGPDFVMAIRNSMTYSRKTGIRTAIGFSLGIATHIFYCLAGLAVVISKSILLFNTVKYIGAAYLIYIGIKSIFSKKSEIKIDEQEIKDDISAFQAIKSGLLTNIFNPKVTLFFLSIFTLMIPPETPMIILFTMSILIIINTALWFSLVAIFFTQKRVQIVFDKFQGIFNKTFGGLLVILGIKIASSKQ